MVYLAAGVKNLPPKVAQLAVEQLSGMIHREQLSDLGLIIENIEQDGGKRFSSRIFPGAR
ncbi:hypothetical protein ABOZ73_10070 [Caulobacter sp. 73W]|uniref:Uncharacterized protein n=1 Tax=Caulobacter sp. 73W TaxID=3161137 RepID=A0AB39KY13_9CAUL